MSRRTPLYDRHLAAGGRMVDFAGWEMPQQYSSVRAEQAAVRHAAGLFDVSHMGRATLGGDGAAAYLQELVTNDVARISPWHAQYNLICREDGGVLDDLILYRSEAAWTVVFNAGNREKDLAWMREHLPKGVTLTDRSDELGLLALQGPKAEEVLQPLTDADLSKVTYLTNPYEAGLGWVVKLDKGSFIGSQALARVVEEGPARVIVGIRSRDRTIPRHDAGVSARGEAIGRVTSGTYSFFLNAGIGMASVRRGTAAVGADVEIESRGGEGRAEVVKLPFYKGTAGTRGSN
jgi:glycine cleavage system aminomethyltransferase T